MRFWKKLHFLSPSYVVITNCVDIVTYWELSTKDPEDLLATCLDWIKSQCIVAITTAQIDFTTATVSLRRVIMLLGTEGMDTTGIVTKMDLN